MKYYIIAGEASGDLHASNLIRFLKEKDKNAVLRAWGGDLMQAQGAEVVKHYRDLAFMGFVEVIQNLKTILNNIKFCKEDISSFKPDALILVDYPGFNLRIAKWAKQQGIKVFYYISPQVWAWKKGRVKTIRKVVDRMFVILPFEKDFFKEWNYDVEFVGHPLIDSINNTQFVESSEFRKKNNLDKEKRIIALLPGSRTQEIKKKLPIMAQVVDSFPEYQFVIGAAPSVDESLLREFMQAKDIKIVYNQTHDLLHASFAALVTSGTATLETALLGIPEVVCYKGSAISYSIAKRIISVNYISLVNLIMDRPVVTELIQGDLNKRNLVSELKKITENKEHRKKLIADYDLLREKLGGTGASERTAERIIELLN
ncbi:MAG: lipid-A-disaccharide synthase [Bacteroidales bacterium]